MRRASANSLPDGAPFPGALLAWLVLVAVWLTWAPFAVRAAPGAPELSLPRNPVDIVGNLLLLAPVAALLALAGRSRGWPRPLLAAGTAAAALSLTLEAGQVLFAGRVVSPYDVALNTAGAVAGAWLALRLARRVGPVAVRRAVAGAVFAGVALHLALAAGATRSGLRLAGWDAAFPVVAGEEAGGTRRFAGRVWDASVCAGEVPRRVCAAPGAGVGERRVLAAEAEASQRASMEATVLSASARQAGPARILTFSAGPSHRNLTLGAQGEDLVLRVRTPATGENGHRLEFVLPDALPPGVETRVSASVADGAVELRAGSAQGVVAGRFDFDPLAGGAMLRSIQFLEPAHLARARLFGAVVLLLPLGIALAGGARLWSRGRTSVARTQRPAAARS